MVLVITLQGTVFKCVKFLTRRYMPEVVGCVNEKGLVGWVRFQGRAELGFLLRLIQIRNENSRPRRKKTIVHEPQKLTLNWARSCE
jgi:hypothetical protein